MLLFACVRVLRDKVDQLEKEFAMLQSSSRSSLPASCSPVRLDLCDLISGLPCLSALGAENVGGPWDTPCDPREAADLVDRTPDSIEEWHKFTWNVEAPHFTSLHSAAAVGAFCANPADRGSGDPPAPPEHCRDLKVAQVAAGSVAPRESGLVTLNDRRAAERAHPHRRLGGRGRRGLETYRGLHDAVSAATGVEQEESLSSGGTQGLSGLTNKVLGQVVLHPPDEVPFAAGIYVCGSVVGDQVPLVPACPVGPHEDDGVHARGTQALDPITTTAAADSDSDGVGVDEEEQFDPESCGRRSRTLWLARWAKDAEEEEVMDWMCSGCTLRATNSVIHDRLDQLEGVGSMGVISMHAAIVIELFKRYQWSPPETLRFGTLCDVAAATFADQWVARALHNVDMRSCYEDVLREMVDVILGKLRGCL